MRRMEGLEYRKSNDIKSKNGEWRCIKPVYLKSRFVLENVVG